MEFSFSCIKSSLGPRGVEVFKALCYKTEGGGF
jgi:hypothetical protein